MTDESTAYDVVEARLGDVLIAEARLPDSLPAGAVRAPADKPILGATPAEAPVPPAEAPASAETPREKYARLLSEGYRPSQIAVLTDAHGNPTSVELAANA